MSPEAVEKINREPIEQSAVRLELVQTTAMVEAESAHANGSADDRHEFTVALSALLDGSKAFRDQVQDVLNKAPNVHSHYIYNVISRHFRTSAPPKPDGDSANATYWTRHLLRSVYNTERNQAFQDSVTLPMGRFQKFLEIAEFNKRNVLPQNNDPFTASYEEMFGRLLQESKAFHNFFGDVVADLKDVEPSNIYRRVLKIYQYQETMANPDEFPRNRSTPESWARPLLLPVHQSALQEQFYGNLFYPIMSNISERGIMLKAVARLHEKREKVRVLDLGCSLNDVLKRLALEGDPTVAEELAYNPVEVMRRIPGQAGEPWLDEEATEAFNNWLHAEPLDLGPSLGIDAVPYEDDRRLRMRAVSDSRYMGELILDNLSRQFEILAHARVPHVSFKDLDAANFDPSSLGEPFDITYLSTMLYQTSPEETKQILANAEQATADDGLVVVQDFIRQFRRNGTIHFYKRWPQYSYGVWVKDMQRRELGYQKYFSVYGGRVERIIPQAALARLAAARQLGLVLADTIKH